MKEFLVNDSRVVNYDHEVFKRLSTDVNFIISRQDKMDLNCLCRLRVFI